MPATVQDSGTYPLARSAVVSEANRFAATWLTDFAGWGFASAPVTVTAVAAVLLGIAVPSFRSFMQNSRLAMQANTLVYSLNLARSASIKLQQPVEVCASSDGASCTGAWTSGWIVCYPIASCAPAGGPPPATVLQVSPALGGGNTVTEEIAGALAVTYLSGGQTSVGPGGASYQFVFCDARGPTFGQDVEINPIGRIQSAGTQGQTISGAALGAC